MTTAARKVPLMRPYVSEQAVDAVAATLRSGWIGQGPQGAEFERRFAEFVGAPHAVAVNTCAAGLRLALAIAGVGPGDEVITTPLTWQATNHPVLEQYARPVFADVQLDTANLDPSDVEHRITERTRAILCVHWGGYPCDLDELGAIARRHGLVVIEEAAEALGATYRGRAIGATSRFTAFSFYAFQTLTTAEGGMLTLRSEADAEAASRRRWFGIDRKRRAPSVNGYYDYDTPEPGYGYHLTDVAAALGLAHLRAAPGLVQRRQSIGARYRQALGQIPGVTLFSAADDRTNGYGLFTMHVERRDEFCLAMRARGIDVSVVHVRNDQYSVFGGLRRDLPNLEQLSDTYICIPMHNHLADEDVDYVIASIEKGW
jgi:perosamine synthetase